MRIPNKLTPCWTRSRFRRFFRSACWAPFNELGDAAFVLLLLVSLSVPVIKDIYLFSLSADVNSSSGARDAVRFGLWGYCLSSINATVDGITSNGVTQCTKARLGYTFDNFLSTSLPGIAGTVVSRALTTALVLHPIACAIGFFAMIPSLFMCIHRRREDALFVSSMLTMVLGLLVASIAFTVFIIDIVLVALVRRRVHSASQGQVALHWGNAVWMVLGAVVALFLSSIGACCGMCRAGMNDERRPRSP